MGTVTRNHGGSHLNKVHLPSVKLGKFDRLLSVESGLLSVRAGNPRPPVRPGATIGSASDSDVMKRSEPLGAKYGIRPLVNDCSPHAASSHALGVILSGSGHTPSAPPTVMSANVAAGSGTGSVKKMSPNAKVDRSAAFKKNRTSNLYTNGSGGGPRKIRPISI